MMHVVFRVDSSSIIGYGHVMRCLTLANALMSKGAQISFISRKHQGHINHLIIEQNYSLTSLPEGSRDIVQHDSDTWLGCTSEEDAQQTIRVLETISPIDYVIADHYAIDATWHSLVARYCRELVVIDDLANRPLLCDVLLDQTLNRCAKSYQHLVAEHCTMLLGKDYMLLRNEFNDYRTQAITQRDKRSRQLGKNNSNAHIMISMGGSDPDNLSKLALLALEKLHVIMPNIQASLVISSQSIHFNSLQSICNRLMWCTLIVDSKDMASQMIEADIAIGASGSTAWERCCLGLPCLTTINAKNQLLIAKNLNSSGATINLGWHKDISSAMICDQIEQLILQPDQYKMMVKNCFNICDGLGAQRVANILIDRISEDCINET